MELFRSAWAHACSGASPGSSCPTSCAQEPVGLLIVYIAITALGRGEARVPRAPARAQLR